jgi:methylated-DNA-protein-cysteine methyltransferase related protein
MGYFEDIRRTVLRIPRGKVVTYGDVANAAGHPGSARQVAWALNGRGSEGLPWQRVLGAGGKILLSGESGLLQRTLLQIEGVSFRGDRVHLQRCRFQFSKNKSTETSRSK